eukprot:1159215-Pelagomonas_calceolata.AAC.14
MRSRLVGVGDGRPMLTRLSYKAVSHGQQAFFASVTCTPVLVAYHDQGKETVVHEPLMPPLNALLVL